MKNFSPLKTAIAFALITLTAFSTGTQTAAASGKDVYLRVITEDTPFYSDADMTDLLFYLPYTYYVKVLSTGETATHVEIGGNNLKLDGFTPGDLLFSDGLPIDNPYPSVSVTTAKSAVLYADKDLSTPLLFVFPSRTMKYYGSADANGEILYYVSYNEYLGYVKETDLIPFTVENHPNPLTFIPESEEPPIKSEPDNPPAETSYSPLAMIVIGALLLAGIIGLIFSVLKKPRQKDTYYYDENEYE